jgi:hypothetical protein
MTTTPLKVVRLGSSPLLIQSGLTESLVGRSDTIPAPRELIFSSYLL